MSVRAIATLQGHVDRAWHCSWSPSEPILATCSSDKSVRFYAYTPPSSLTSTTSSTTTTSPTSKFNLSSSLPSAHPRTIRSLSFSPTGQTLTTSSFDSTVGIWSKTSVNDDGERQTEEEPGEWIANDPLEGHESECKSSEWSSDGRLLATCSRDKSVWVWEAVSPTEFECLAVLMEHTQDVKSVTWHPREELLASASYDDTIKLYCADPYDDEWSCIQTLLGHESTVWSLCFSPCGHYLISSSDDLTLRIWQRFSKDPIGQLGEQGVKEAEREEGGRMGPWSRSGVRIGMKERFEWKQVKSIEGLHDRTIYSVDWKKGGRKDGLGRIVSCGGDGRINVLQILKPPTPGSAPEYELVSSVESAHGVYDINHVSWCTLSPSQAAKTLRKLEGGEGEEEEEGMELDDHQEGVEEGDPRWTGVENMFASAGDDGLVKIWVVEE